MSVKKIIENVDPNIFKITKSKKTRTSFALTEKSYDVIDQLKKRGIGLSAAVDLFRTFWKNNEDFVPMLLKTQDSKESLESTNKRRRHPQTVDESTISFLKKISKEFDIPRDRLLEIAINVVLFALKNSEAQKWQHYQEIEKRLSEILSKINEIEKYASEHLSEDDPIIGGLSEFYIVGSNLDVEIEEWMSELGDE